jgi:hypothetical protein
MENHLYICQYCSKEYKPIDDRNKSIAAIVAERELLPLESSKE